jgi:hypothetical protein
MNTRAIVELVRQAQEIAAQYGIVNILQPGIIKELIVADLLGHEIIPTKANADAKDANGNLFEYLCSLESSNNFQIDRITDENLNRISRNAAIYCAFFSDPLTVSTIYHLEPAVVLDEVKRQLAKSKNVISHVNLGGRWVRDHGTPAT